MKRLIFFIAAILVLSLTITSCKNNKDTSSVAVSGSKESSYSNNSSKNPIESHSESYSAESIGVSEDVSDNVSVNESTAASSATVSENEPAGILTSSYLSMFKKGTYMIKISSIPSKIGDSVIYSDISCYYKPGSSAFEQKQYGKIERTVVIGNFIYTIDNDNKKIIKDSADGYIHNNIPKLTGLTHDSDGVDTIDGVMYDLESFKDSKGNIVTFLYRNTILKKMRSYIPSMDEYAEYNVEIKSSYDTSIFTLPSGYEEIDLS